MDVVNEKPGRSGWNPLGKGGEGTVCTRRSPPAAHPAAFSEQMEAGASWELVLPLTWNSSLLLEFPGFSWD